MVNLDVQEQLLNHIERHALCKTTDKILLAVSGGLDSMVMFHLMKNAGFRVGVAHCNFQLRGEESLADEALVRATSVQRQVPFFSRKFETARHATAERISIQMAARDLRYTWFEDLLAKEGYDYVATAHHFNDVIETVFMNMVRGTGIDGLIGISPKKQRVIRPLLFASRRMLLDYAVEHEVAWREDASNLKDDYPRNFIRHQVIPRLEELNPNFEGTFRDTHERLTGAVQFSASHIKSFKTQAVTVSGHSLSVDIAKIRTLESPAVMLWEIIKDFGFKYDHCKKVVADHQPGKVFFSVSHQLVVDRDLYLIAPKRTLAFATVEIEEGQRECHEGGQWLAFTHAEQPGYILRKDSALAQLDADLLRYPLTWRTWRAGDYFTPLGMAQEKKLSDFLIDLKIPFHHKADVTVLESGGDIVWVVGYRISERYKVKPETRRVLVIERTLGG